MQYKIIFLLFAGHLMTDVVQGMVPALLPYFIAEYNLAYSAAGFLILALTVSSSVVQPIFGYLADRISLPWFMALGPLLVGVGIAMAGLSHKYYLVVIGIFICGLGVAAFHPEGARMAGIASGDKKSSGMSIFSVGGNAGIALGPLIAAGLIFLWGIKGVAFYCVPAFIMAIILFRASSSFSDLATVVHNQRNYSIQNTENNVSKLKEMNDAWVPFILLTLAIICRSILFTGINTFLPSYWIEIFHSSKESAATALTILLAMGVVGNLVGGRLADRFGSQKTVFLGFILLVPQLFIFVNLTNPMYATLLLLIIGFTSYVSFSPMIVMGQQYLPNRVGFASGITIGLAVSVGGFAAPILGKLADFAGVQSVFYFLILFPALAVVIVWFLPKALRAQALKSVKNS